MKLGSLCAGYGGLDLAASAVLGSLTHAWHAENDPDASRVLAHHWPDVPNLGDLRAVNWSTVEPVDVLTAGFPCQPVSAAGRRQGTHDERWLWDDIATAIGRMGTRPRLLLLENVPGLLSANRGHAMARVVHGLARLGYVGRYRVVRASDVGACHRRARVFIAAWPAGTFPPAPPRTGTDRRRAVSGPGLTLLPTPRASDDKRGSEPLYAGRTGRDSGPALPDVIALLPTPQARDHKGADFRGERPDGAARTAAQYSLPRVVVLLPTPRASDGEKGGPNQRGSSGDLMLSAAVQPERFGIYAPAVARHELAFGRPAPEPTEPGRNGPRLAPRFPEWMMGVPAGWVTDILPRKAALRVIGNGVVPQQGAHALAGLLDTANTQAAA